MDTDIATLGYLALPPAGQGPGIIVIQEWWGLVPHIQAVADRFAEAGYVALAPDLYQGEKTTSPDEASRLMMALNIEQTAQRLHEAASCLMQHPAVNRPKLGVVGFCMGGQLALLAATVSDAFGAVVDFYGIHPNVQPDFSQLTAPVLGLFGDQDAFITPDAVRHLVNQVQAADKMIAVEMYGGAGHAFFNDTRPEAYDAAAASDAWKRTLIFLEENLPK